jgi:hypothetical protein
MVPMNFASSESRQLMSLVSVTGVIDLVCATLADLDEQLEKINNDTADNVLIVFMCLCCC